MTPHATFRRCRICHQSDNTTALHEPIHILQQQVLQFMTAAIDPSASSTPKTFLLSSVFFIAHRHTQIATELRGG
jgi:hypothetical protein